MKFLSQLLLILFPIPCPAILGYKLDYLMDSFRVIPAFAQIKEELRSLNSSDHWTLAGMIALGACITLGNLMLIWKIKKLERKRNENNLGNPV